MLLGVNTRQCNCEIVRPIGQETVDLSCLPRGQREFFTRTVRTKYHNYVLFSRHNKVDFLAAPIRMEDGPFPRLTMKPEVRQVNPALSGEKQHEKIETVIDNQGIS